MKKKLLISATLLLAIFAQAQESPLVDSSIIKNKRGVEILPKKGDICLGFNTIPILMRSIKVNRYFFALLI